MLKEWADRVSKEKSKRAALSKNKSPRNSSFIETSDDQRENYQKSNHGRSEKLSASQAHLIISHMAADTANLKYT